jgi:hypothetical protein
MKLSVYVLGREVAALESVGDFKSVLTKSLSANSLQGWFPLCRIL